MVKALGVEAFEIGDDFGDPFDVAAGARCVTDLQEDDSDFLAAMFQYVEDETEFSEVFKALRDALMENEKLTQHPEIAAKLAELCPMAVADVRVIIASKRIAMDTPEIEELITVIRQHAL